MTSHAGPEAALDTVDLSVILVTWNALAVTAQALDSIRAHVQGITYEVFVVDNGTTKDATPTELPRRFPWVRFIANPDNRGFSRANNQPIQQSRGRFILLLNNDTIQTENALGQAVHYMDAHAEVGALGIMHRNNDREKSFQSSFFAFPRPWRDLLAMLSFRRSSAQPVPTVEEKDVDWVCGSFLMMRKECLAQVGPLDERFFIYDEDIDWCLQASRAGWKIRFWPGASMIHLGSQSFSLMTDKNLTMFSSHRAYLRKNHGLAAAAAYHVVMGLMLTLGTAKQLVRLLIGKAKLADVRQRWQRQRNFLTLRSGKVGG